MLNHRSIILGKIESAYATDPTPAAASNAIQCENISHGFANARMYSRVTTRVSQAKLKQLHGGTLYELKFDVEVKGSGTAGTAPEIGPLLRACGMAETVVGATSVTYKPASSGAPTLYFYIYVDGKIYKMAGVVGKLSGVVQVGQPVKFSFTFLGHFVSEADGALVSPTFNATVPNVAIGVPVVMDSVSTFSATKLDFDLGVTVATPDNIVAADGYGQLQIVDRNVTGNIDPEDVTVATYDFVTKWKSNAAFALTTGVMGATAGNRLQITFAAASNQEVARGDKGGIITRPLKLGFAESSGDDEISIIFT